MHTGIRLPEKIRADLKKRCRQSGADAVILTLGGKHGTCSMATMGEGVDAADINLPECQDTFIQAAAACGKPLIGVHFDGRPISSDTADQYLDAIIEAWNPAETGAQAVADVLLGVYNPAVSCRYPWHITPDRFQFIIITRTVLHGTSRRVSDLSTMWIFPIHRDIASGMDCLIHGLVFRNSYIGSRDWSRRIGTD